ncbi:MAG: SUMF1/EgtB/PvdO family nonheme iron enzyme [Anaerolineae bacterium]
MGQRQIGSGAVSPYGVLDTAGNLWEWTPDWYDARYCDSAPCKNPQGLATGCFHPVSHFQPVL